MKINTNSKMNTISNNLFPVNGINHRGNSANKYDEIKSARLE